MNEKILEFLKENPELAVSMFRELIGKYKPAFYNILGEFVEMYRDYSNNTDFPAIVAKTKKNMYDAYVEAGFTEDQALALMLNDNLQLMKQVNKMVSSGARAK